MATRKKNPLRRGRGAGVLFNGLGMRRDLTAADHARMVASVAHDVLPFLAAECVTTSMAINAGLAVREAFAVAEVFVAERERRYALASARPAPPKKSTKKKGKR